MSGPGTEAPGSTHVISDGTQIPGFIPDIAGKSHRKRTLSRDAQAESWRITQRERYNRLRISIVLQAIKTQFGQALSHPELLVITQFVCERHGLKIDRDAKRHKRGLVVWCAENLEAFLEALPKVIGEKCIDGQIVPVPALLPQDLLAP